MSNPAPFILGVALDATPGIATESLLDTQLRAARALDAASVDFLTLGDSFEGPAFDASLTASFFSPLTRQIGLVPTITTTHTEPFHISTAIATLDYSAWARAGWSAAPSLGKEAAEAFGRRDVAQPDAAWAETGQVVEVVRALWDSWEPDAEIRDTRTGRFLDREKLHYIDAVLQDSVGEPYTVKGPSIVPAPPQGNPPVVITITDEAARRTAITHADVLIVPVASIEEAIQANADLTEELQGRRATILPSLSLPAGNSGVRVREIAAPLIEAGLAGVHLRLENLENDAAAIAQEVSNSRGSLGYHRPGFNLRDRFGLAAAENRFASA